MSDFVYKIVGTNEELQEAKRIRHAVFVIEQGIPEEDDNDGQDENSIHLMVKKGSETVGTGRLTFLGKGRALLSRIAVVKPERGQGLGKRIIRELESIAQQNSILSLYLDPHNHLEAFYRNLGYVKEAGWSRAVAKYQLIRMHKKI